LKFKADIKILKKITYSIVVNSRLGHCSVLENFGQRSHTLPIEKIITLKNAQAWVSMFFT
jgi:hypothetical protein